MGFFDDPFDLNNDGRRSMDEDYLEFMMFNEFMNKHYTQDDYWDSSFDEFDDEEDICSDDDISSYGAVTEHISPDVNTRDQEKEKRAEQFRMKLPVAADPEILKNFDDQLTRFAESKKKQNKGKASKALLAVLIIAALIVILIITISIVRTVRENNRISSVYSQAEEYYEEQVGY